MKFLKTPVSLALCSALILSGCASASKDIATGYTSPMQYTTYNCEQLQMEAGRLQSRIVELGGHLDKAAQNDKAIVGVGMILFWPVLFAVGGNKAQEAEYGRLKGDYEAINQSMNTHNCGAPRTRPASLPVAAPADASTS